MTHCFKHILNLNAYKFLGMAEISRNLHRFYAFILQTVFARYIEIAVREQRAVIGDGQYRAVAAASDPLMEVRMFGSDVCVDAPVSVFHYLDIFVPCLSAVMACVDIYPRTGNDGKSHAVFELEKLRERSAVLEVFGLGPGAAVVI